MKQGSRVYVRLYARYEATNMTIIPKQYAPMCATIMKPLQIHQEKCCTVLMGDWYKVNLLRALLRSSLNYSRSSSCSAESFGSLSAFIQSTSRYSNYVLDKIELKYSELYICTRKKTSLNCLSYNQ
eukprot:TRINITY_DN20236_c0_g1_i1.p2 TRINITY_DN20236_c0_g1~~TRINITY_DN20236_c0_g1_i1.p2  ORF type:complete len:126 (+),score=0.74 TRINITY_DN20236_c0_g1_i1:3-380(+)